MVRIRLLESTICLVMVAGATACASIGQSPPGAASTGQSPPDAAAAEAILAQRLANLPRVRPWPISWFEPKEIVRGGSSPASVPRSRAQPLIGEDAWGEAVRYAQETQTDALMVWHRGQPDRVWYRQGFDPRAMTNTYYLNFFALILAVGAAVEDGSIRSIDQSVADFIPEWRGTNNANITVRHLLQMRAGLELYQDSINPRDKATRTFFGADSTAAALEYAVKDPAGSTFEYNYIVPEILGIVLERATRRRYADYLSEKIWRPLGNSDASVWLDREGGRPHFNAALFADADDWMRVGALIAGKGMYGGRRILPASWIESMLAPSPAKPNYGMTWLARPYEAVRRLSPQVNYVVRASEPIAFDDMAILDGYGGQRVYVSPAQDLVIVRIGAAQRDNWDDSRFPNIIARGMRR